MDAAFSERPWFSGTGSPPSWSQDGMPKDAADEAAYLAGLVNVAPLAPRVWVPAGVEASYYRLNQLGPQIAAVFGSEASSDPDEDEIEDLVPDAQALLASHVLDDLFVEAFYDACRSLPDRLVVRRLGARHGIEASKGRPALLALRSLWRQDWETDTVVARLRRGEGLLPQPRVAVVHGTHALAEPSLVALAEATLGTSGLEVTAVDGRVAGIFQSDAVAP